MTQKNLWFTALFTAFLLLIATGALAEPAAITPVLYNPLNDLPLEYRNLRNQSDEMIRELRHGTFNSVGLLPLAEGTILLYGTFQYDDLVMELPHDGGFDRDLPRTDAYAIAVDENGERLWSLRLSDPQAQNGFDSAWLMEDGRILMKYGNYTGEMGSLYYILTQDGEIQELLPAYKARAYGNGVYETLEPFAGGYLGGGLGYQDNAFGAMEKAVSITFFDDQMEPQWQFTDDSFLMHSFYEKALAEDGILFAGSERYQEDPTSFSSWEIPCVIKLSSDGELLWRYTGHQYATVGTGFVHPTEDGGALFTSEADTEVAAPFDFKPMGMLTKLDGRGNVEWTREYYSEYGFAYFTDMMPYKDGLLLTGHTGSIDAVALLHVGLDGVPIEKMDIELPERHSVYAMLTCDTLTGDAYVFGVIERHDPQTGDDIFMSDAVPYYANIDKETSK